MLLIGSIYALASIIVFPVSIIRFRNSSSNLLFVKVTAFLSRLVLGLKVDFSGLENSKRNLPAIFIMNHQTALDIMLNREVFPRNCLIVVKRGLAYVPFFGWIVFAAGNILLQRTNKQQSLSQMRSADLAISMGKSSVWVFPEGTRRGAKGLGAFKKGAFYMAIKNKVPIIPVIASSYANKLDFNKWKSGLVSVQVLPPISTEGLSLEDVDETLKISHQIMKTALINLDTKMATST
jgi:1-acyl-sn-glycerol-3-phosphate acyltransferase